MSKDNSKTKEKIVDSTSKKLTLSQFVSVAPMNEMQRNVVKKMFEKDKNDRTYSQWLTDCQKKKIFGARQIAQMKRN